ncbi:hypothetical protein B9Z45_13165 [Limnohabitans sp. 2KL-17]|uniref:glycosyltransferase n=1 Tax=Limnohabitans sp. 2KL-17 TaxID=1100704 RepID=UPI000D33FD4E|nr:glycosyltransferase [Limnohabitans sp. 2KL-17]PUE53043.1 hypothetical protein B9Z45_13165 [Limnohabitans sp. 2KL-17]
MSSSAGPARHLLFVLLGTGGDVWPALGLAKAARDAGNEVEVATYAQFEPEVRALGLGFHAIGSREEFLATLCNPVFWSRHGSRLALAEGGYLRLAIPRVQAVISSMRERRPVLVCTRNAFGARFAAEMHGLTCVSLIYSPQQLITPQRMPYPVNGPIMRALPRWYWRAGLRLGDCFGIERLRPTLNQLREPLGLPPIENLRDWLFFGTPGLALYPAWFDDLAPLAGAGIRQGDFVLRHVDESEVLDDRLEGFLDAGPPPVVCTLGTGIAHAAPRYAQVARALARTGRRGLFVTPFDENIPREFGAHILRVDFANLACVLRRASLLIHHGGIGTATQALRAATPQIILPFYYDQADNGDRVRRLGAGTMIEGPVPDAEALAEAMERCGALPSRPLESLRQRIRSGRGAQACFETLENLLMPPPRAGAGRSTMTQEAWQ